MAEKILDALMDVFNFANYRFLTLIELTQQLQRRGFYQNIEFHKAEADVWDHLCRDCTASYPFWGIEKGEDTLWGLERWLPPKHRRQVRRHVQTVEPLHVAWEVQHILSPSGFEIETGRFPLRGQNFNRFIASMDMQQREHSIVELCCYGSEKFICAIVHDDRGIWFIEGMALQYWYKENGLQPGDKIWLAVERITPLVLKIYTEWDRDADSYRRYEQHRNLESLQGIDLPIRDLIWIYFKQTQKVAHRSEITKTILEYRPLISERSIDACLSANTHLFVCISEGNWGLKEWGIEQVTMVIRPKGSDTVTAIDENLPIIMVPIDYILANIAAEDLVYKVLRSSKASLSDSQITERIAKYLGVDRSILARTSFFIPSDSRFVRLHDGTFTLRENLEEVIDEMMTKERELRQSVDRNIEEVNRLKDEMAYMVSRHKAQIRKLENERDEGQHLAREWFEQHSQLTKKWLEERTILSRLLSKVRAKIIPNIIRTKLHLIFTRLSRKPEPHREEEEEI